MSLMMQTATKRMVRNQVIFSVYPKRLAAGRQTSFQSPYDTAECLNQGTCRSSQRAGMSRTASQLSGATGASSA